MLNYGKVSKYCKNGCLQDFIFFMFLLTVKLEKRSHINASIFFVFLNIVQEQTSSSFNTKLKPLWKDRKSTYQVQEISGLLLPLTCSKFSLKQRERPYSSQKLKNNYVWRSLGVSKQKKVSRSNNSQNTWD